MMRTTKEVRVRTLQKKNYYVNINKHIQKIFNNIRFMYTCKKKRQYCHYKNYEKKWHMRTWKAKIRLYKIEVKNSWKILFNRRIKKRNMPVNITSWTWFDKQVKSKKNKLINYHYSFKKLYDHNNLCALLTSSILINKKT